MNPDINHGGTSWVTGMVWNLQLLMETSWVVIEEVGGEPNECQTSDKMELL